MPQVQYSMRKYASVVLDFCPCIITNRAPGLHRKKPPQRQVRWPVPRGRVAGCVEAKSLMLFVPTKREMPKFAGRAQMGIDFANFARWQWEEQHPVHAHTVQAQGSPHHFLQRYATVRVV